MKGNERMQGGSEDMKSSIGYLKLSLDSDLSDMPEEKKAVLESIIKDMDEIRESFMAVLKDDIETGSNNFDRIDEYDVIMYDKYRGVMKQMRSLGTNKDIADLFGLNLVSFRKNLKKGSDKKILLQNMKDLDTDALMFNSTVALESSREKLKKEIKPAEVVEEPKEAVETRDFDKVMKMFVARLENGITGRPKYEVNTDSLVRAQDMCYTYASAGSGKYSDRIFLKTAIEALSLRPRFNSMKDKDYLIDNMSKMKASDIVYVIAAYQSIRNLKVDGKFGKNTFAALRDDAGVEIKHQPTGQIVDKYVS